MTRDDDREGPPDIAPESLLEALEYRLAVAASPYDPALLLAWERFKRGVDPPDGDRRPAHPGGP